MKKGSMTSLFLLLVLVLSGTIWPNTDIFINFENESTSENGICHFHDGSIDTLALEGHDYGLFNLIEDSSFIYVSYFTGHKSIFRYSLADYSSDYILDLGTNWSLPNYNPYFNSIFMVDRTEWYGNSRIWSISFDADSTLLVDSIEQIQDIQISESGTLLTYTYGGLYNNFRVLDLLSSRVIFSMTSSADAFITPRISKNDSLIAWVNHVLYEDGVKCHDLYLDSTWYVMAVDSMITSWLIDWIDDDKIAICSKYLDDTTFFFYGVYPDGTGMEYYFDFSTNRINNFRILNDKTYITESRITGKNNDRVEFVNQGNMIKLTSNYNGYEYYIYNIIGRLTETGFINRKEYEIDINEYSSGVYLIRLVNLNNQEIKLNKFLKIH
ncbi:MAG: T9SS type A sorting domain-containing protein [bacterium]